MPTFKNISYLFKLLWDNYKAYFVFGLALTLSQLILNLVQVAAPKVLIDFLTKKEFISASYTIVAMCFILFLMNGAQSYFSYRNTLISQKFNIKLNSLLSRKALSIPYQEFEEFNTREEYQFAVKCTKEGTVENVINAIITSISSLLALISILYITSYIVWWIWCIIVLSVAINAACEYFRAKYNYGSTKQQNAVEMRMLYARDRLTWKSFAKEVRLFGMYDFVTQTALNYINALADIQKKRAGKTFLILSFTFIINAAQMIAVYGFIAYKCYTGKFSVGDFAMLTVAMLNIAKTASGVATGIVSVKEQSDYINSFVKFLKHEKTKRTKSNLPDSDFTITFNGVRFSYPGSNNLVLDGINYSFQSGKKYGIVGANGSGKSTMVKLLMGLYTPDEGEILINNIPMSEIEDENIFNWFSPVMQEFNIYAYKIKENIAMNDKINEDLLINKINAMKLKDKLNSLNNQADSFITAEYDKDGTELSGGELQKIAIARAMYKDAPVFVLDEPSSALSPKSEYELYQSIHANLKQKTIFFISHRMASCRMCDEILVFDKGQIVETGTHEQLMRLNGIYEEMFSAQASLYSEVAL